MEIKQHPASEKFLVVSSPAPDALKLAEKAGKAARIEKSGSITFSATYRSELERIAEKHNRLSAIVPTVADFDELSRWAVDNLNAIESVQLIERNGERWFNERFAGKTVADVEAYCTRH